MKIEKLLIAAALLATPVLGFAQDETGQTEKPKKAKKDPAQVFKSMDKDSDGKVSKDEFMANKKGTKSEEQGQKTFTSKDKDSDGFLTLEEFSAKRPN